MKGVTATAAKKPTPWLMLLAISSPSDCSLFILEGFFMYLDW
jgi:hypothetical protein